MPYTPPFPQVHLPYRGWQPRVFAQNAVVLPQDPALLQQVPNLDPVQVILAVAPHLPFVLTASAADVEVDVGEATTTLGVPPAVLEGASQADESVA